MNIAKGKDVLTHHINLAFYINNQMKAIDHQHCYGLEQTIILGEDLKTIQNVLENKMSKQYNRDKILRLMCLFSVTQSGLKTELLDNLRRFYIMNYGYSELITLMALQEARLLRPKDKKFDWNKLKKVRYKYQY
jgi:vacuolar protein sorting-associated protein 33A